MARSTDILYALGIAAASPVIAWRMLSTGKHRTDWKARLARCEYPKPDGRPTILIHGVSVGEVNAIRMLVRDLAERTRCDEHPEGWRIVVSASTDTGIARARSVFEPDHQVVRFPFDFSGAVKRFLDGVQPDVVALVELEVWPNFTEICAQRGIPVAVINGRLSERSHRGYKRFNRFVRPMFSRLSRAAVQSEAIAERFIDVGVPRERVVVTDSMKWDTAQVADEVEGSDTLARAMGIDPDKPLIVAGSTGPGEEALLIETCPPDAQLMLVPRKPERFEEVARLDALIVRRTDHPDDGEPRPLDGQRLFLLDTMGELRKAYALADVAIVGRSFLGLYGSDMMEPCALGKPVIIGPHHSDFASIMEAFVTADAIEVSSEPGKVAAELLADPDRAAALAKRAREVILSHQGATETTGALMMELGAKRLRD